MPDAALVTRYVGLLQKLLPPGASLNRRGDSSLAAMLKSLSVELARIHERVSALYDESFYDTADELLDDWEDLVSLPIPGTALSTTTQSRKADIRQRFSATRGQSEADITAIAWNDGVDSWVVNYEKFPSPFCAGHRCGHPIYGPEWGFVININLVDFICNNWSYDAGTFGTGDIKLNDGTIASATALDVSIYDGDGRDVSEFLSSLTTSDRIALIEPDFTSSAMWDISSVTDNTSYYTYGLSNLTDSGSFHDGTGTAPVAGTSVTVGARYNADTLNDHTLRVRRVIREHLHSHALAIYNDDGSYLESV